MSWHNELQPASFRGVPFYWREDDTTFGRRTNLHEFPLRDTPFTEDMGRKARTYSVEAYVIGVEYMAARDALMAALEEAGSGTLVHRYFGQIRVKVYGEPRVKHSSQEGGWAKFSITFVDAGDDDASPVQRIDTRQRVQAQAATTTSVLQSQFTQNYSVTGVPGWVSNASKNVLGQLDGTLGMINNIENTISNVFDTPNAIASNVVAVIGGLSSLTNFDNLVTLWKFGDIFSSVKQTTPSRIRQAKNQQSVINLVQGVAVVEAAKQSTEISYESQKNAIDVRNQIADVLDEQMDSADDETFVALQDLQTVVVRDLTDRAAKLRQISNYTPKDTMPSLVIAHQLYQDAFRESEIVTRNHVRHPGFITGGDVLEVLNA